jgi:hypothetical protein|tara:strand:+ start:289 stop:513 length:225 start_codon:yes stop_codon:yes gene_type:complete
VIKLKKLIIKEQSETIQVSGIGTYDHPTLKKKVQRMATDLAKIAKSGKFSKSSKISIKAFGQMWDALDQYERNS